MWLSIYWPQPQAAKHFIKSCGSLPLEGATSTVASGERAQAVVRAQHRAEEGGWNLGTRFNHPSLTLPLKGRGPEERDYTRFMHLLMPRFNAKG
jgi:hypothetical protein